MSTRLADTGVRYPLAAMAKARGVRRSHIELRPIPTPTRLEGEVREISLAVVRHWREAVRTELMPLLAREMTTDAPADGASGFFETTNRVAGQLLVTLDQRMLRWVSRINAFHKGRWEANVKAASGVDISGLSDDLARSNELIAYRKWASSLIRDLSDETRQRIENITYEGLAAQTPRRSIAKSLQEAFGIERRRALTISRDQTTKISGKLDELRQQEAGIERYVWVHSGKSNPRDEHVRRDGRIFRWDSPPSDGHPGDAINCGCNARAVLDLD